MQVRITFETNLPAMIDKVVANFDKKQAGLLQEIGQNVLSLQRLNFEKKSRRGAGDDGIVWAPLAESTERKKYLKGLKRPRKGKWKPLIGPVPRSQIGVDTGLMRNCVTPGYQAPDGRGGNILEISGSSVTVGYAREYAPYFDQGNGRSPARPLMPETMPTAWQKSVESLVDDWARDVVSELWTGPATQVNAFASDWASGLATFLGG